MIGGDQSRYHAQYQFETRPDAIAAAAARPRCVRSTATNVRTELRQSGKNSERHVGNNDRWAAYTPEFLILNPAGSQAVLTLPTGL